MRKKSKSSSELYFKTFDASSSIKREKKKTGSIAKSVTTTSFIIIDDQYKGGVKTLTEEQKQKVKDHYQRLVDSGIITDQCKTGKSKCCSCLKEIPFAEFDKNDHLCDLCAVNGILDSVKKTDSLCAKILEDNSRCDTPLTIHGTNTRSSNHNFHIRDNK